MNWKELFKPTKGKIILTLIPVITEFYATIFPAECYWMDAGNCNKFLYYISRPFYTPLERVGDYSVILMIILGLLFFSVVFYLISCLIISIFKKNAKNI